LTLRGNAAAIAVLERVEDASIAVRATSPFSSASALCLDPL
jgi:hypothetical protein